MWRGMLHDMYNLMRHVVGAMTVFMQLRRIFSRYRHGRAATCDHGQSASNDSSSPDLSPRPALDEHEPPLASSSSHHGDEAGPLATSSQQPTASISTSHDHQQARPSTMEAALLTEQTSTTTSYIDVVVPPVDASISTSDHDHEQARPSTVEATPFTK